MFAIFIMMAVTESDMFYSLLILYYLAIIILTISVSVRHLHDIGKGGAAVLWIFVLVLSFILFTFVEKVNKVITYMVQILMQYRYHKQKIGNNYRLNEDDSVLHIVDY
ncbi:DUF805 domain-containing protein [Neobacillus cucumis]|uniref:DUF805 domain-containing protein n=1 Tax=Neobacillus cucumis TaxID=1740721 RepID=UPI0035A83D87